MKGKNTFGVHFTIRQNRGQHGKSPIYARIVVNSTRAEISIKAFVAPDEWNPKRGAAKPKNEELRLLNNYLEDVRGKLFTHYRDLKIEEENLTAEAVKNPYLGLTEEKEEAPKTLLWLAAQHNLLMVKVLKDGSMKNYYTTERYLEKFLKTKFPSGDIALNQIRYELITALEYYIRNEPIKIGDPCTNNGTMKHLQRLRKMINWAVKNEWIERDPFSNFKLHFKRAERDFLTREEMTLIENVELDIPMLQKVREIFMFSCYTGLSYVDVINLKPHQIVNGTDGVKWITSSRTKTDIAVNVPLLQQARIILDKFKDDKYAMVSETVFPPYTNQDVNRSLKLIGGLCKMKKQLTFHMARHTFATTVTLMNGVPIESISKMLGHSKITTTMIYARVSQSKIGMDMLLLQNKLDEKKEK